MVFVEVPGPFWNPPRWLVEVATWDHPENVENRDYLRVEKEAWAARRQIGDIPLTVISNEYSADEIAAAEFPEERLGMRKNVQVQRGWFVLSPLARSSSSCTRATRSRRPIRSWCSTRFSMWWRQAR